MKLLLLAGTKEAREISFALKGVELISSLAGATERPAELGGVLRIGGFGGDIGLKQYLREGRIDAVIDATHPFAAQMSQNAYAACKALGVPLLQVVRPAWTWRSDWKHAEDFETAAELLDPATRVFLATGRGSLAHFANREDVFFVARVIDDVPGAFPLPNGAFLVSLPPFTVAMEIATLKEHKINTLVTRNSGGTGGFEKIEAAQVLGIDVIMIARPKLPEAKRVTSVPDALAYVEREWLGG